LISFPAPDQLKIADQGPKTNGQVQKKGHAIDAKAQKAGCNQVPVGKMGFSNVLLVWIFLGKPFFPFCNLSANPGCRNG